MNTKKLLSILGAAGVAVHVAGVTADFARASASPSTLERMLQDDPTGDDAAAIFDMLADKGGKGDGGKGGGGKGGGGKGNGTGDGDHNGNGHGGGHDGNNGHGDDHGHDDDHGHYEG